MMKKMWHFTKTYIYFVLISKSFTDSCDCKSEKLHNIKNSQIVPEKRETEQTKYHTKQEPSNNITIEDNFKVLNETLFELNETIFKANDVENEVEDIKEFCSHFKNGTELNVDKMVDVWKIVYYEMAEKLPCFKIHIKKTTSKNRQIYAKTYGDFNGAVNWNECHLEIIREKYNAGSTKHFLQGTREDLGVLENIVMTEENRGNIKTATLKQEAPDQWMVVNNLLLMRDCDNGGIVVFSRVPHEPRSKDIIDALEKFGEEVVNGTMACDQGYLLYKHGERSMRE